MRIQSSGMGRLKYAVAQWQRDSLQYKTGSAAYGKAGLRSVAVKKYNHHANHGTGPDDKENILKRDFETETIN